MASLACDLAIIGGGLSGGLIALAAQRARPSARILLIEARPRLGGNHIWSFLDSDIEPADKGLLERFVTYGWRECEVVFPAYKPALPQALYSIRSDRFDQALREQLPPDGIVAGRPVTGLSADGVVLEDGTLIAARGVIDARGAADLDLLDIHWRKFVGYELHLDGPHSVRRATLIDAAADPAPGFQFMTMLPIEADRLFIEDVRFEPHEQLDLADHGQRIVNHAARFGWRILSSARGQAGKIPIVLGGDFEAYWRSSGPGIAKAGLRAGLFHPVTGSSIGDAAHAARLVAEAGDWSGAALHKMLHAHAAKRWARRDYYRRFARHMLIETAPQQGHEVLEALYAKDSNLIARFHAARLTFVDRLSLSTGEGPMPLSTILKGRP